jgi:hypothetical protein
VTEAGRNEPVDHAYEVTIMRELLDEEIGNHQRTCDTLKKTERELADARLALAHLETPPPRKRRRLDLEGEAASQNQLPAVEAELLRVRQCFHEAMRVAYESLYTDLDGVAEPRDWVKLLSPDAYKGMKAYHEGIRSVYHKCFGYP